MQNVLNPYGLFGTNLGLYIKIDEKSHQQNIKEFENLCKKILQSIKSLKGIKNLEIAEFKLEKPFSDILVMISSENYYLRFDFLKKDNIIFYFNKEGYRDDLSLEYRWILRVLLDNKEDLLESLYYKVRREISFAANKIYDDELRRLSILFTQENFTSTIEGFFPKLGKVIFKSNSFDPVRHYESFAISNNFFSLDQLRFKVVEYTKKSYEFEIYYSSFLLSGRLVNYSNNTSSPHYEYELYDVYHKEDKVLLYSYKEDSRKTNINTKEGPQEYRLAAFLPLIKIYDILLSRIEKKS